MKTCYYFLLIPILLLVSCKEAMTQKQKQPKQEQSKAAPYLLLVENDSTGEQAYQNPKGEIVIPYGKYSFCFTDTFKTFAIVASKEGFIGINRKEEKLFKVFMYDNGPDYVQEGLFRIQKEDKIGYADTQGNIIISPQFTCAYPFKDGKAKVATNCKVVQDGEHSFWESEEWFWIDKTGKKLE